MHVGGLLDELKGRVGRRDGGALEQSFDGGLYFFGRVRQYSSCCGFGKARRREQCSRWAQGARKDRRGGAAMPPAHHGGKQRLSKLDLCGVCAPFGKQLLGSVVV